MVETIDKKMSFIKCDVCGKDIPIILRRRIYAAFVGVGINSAFAPAWLCDECFKREKKFLIKWCKIFLFICVPIAILLSVGVIYLVMKQVKI